MSESNLMAFSRVVNLAVDATRARQSLVWLGMTIIGLLSVPEDIAGWTIFWITVAALGGSLTLTNLYQARRLEEPRRSLFHLAITFGAGLIAVVITMSLRPIAGMFLLVVLCVLAYTSEHRPFVTAALTVVAVPWWVWLTADAWHWQLLMLVPLVGLGLAAVSHLLDTHAWPEGDTRILPERAHRAAAWILIALTGVVIILVGLFIDVSRPWLALAGIVLAASIPLEAGVGVDEGGSAVPGIRVLTGAYLIAICCWLIGIG